MGIKLDTGNGDANKIDNDFYSAGKAYWDKIEPTVDGMLGGYTQVTHADVNSSMKLLDKYFVSLEKKSKLKNKQKNKQNGVNGECQLTRALDAGAGIGRVTKHLLSKYFDVVDLLEQNDKFLAESKNYIGDEGWARVGQTICCSLQDFVPNSDVKYDCIWLQWVTGHLTDDDFVDFLVRCKAVLKPNGILVVKDNVSSSDEIDDDHNDSSITRPQHLFENIFKRAEFVILKDKRQYKMPKGLYPIKMFVLKPL